MKRTLPILLLLPLFSLSPRTADAEPQKLEVQEVADTGSMPKGTILSKDGTRFYVTNFGQLDKRNITIYDSKSLAQIDQIDVPGIVVESILSPDGKILYVSNFKRSSVMAIDLETKSIKN